MGCKIVMIQNALVFDNYKVTLRGKKKKEVTDIRINQIFLLGNKKTFVFGQLDPMVVVVVVGGQPNLWCD